MEMIRKQAPCNCINKGMNIRFIQLKEIDIIIIREKQLLLIISLIINMTNAMRLKFHYQICIAQISTIREEKNPFHESPSDEGVRRGVLFSFVNSATACRPSTHSVYVPNFSFLRKVTRRLPFLNQVNIVQ